MEMYVNNFFKMNWILLSELHVARKMELLS